MIDGMIDGIIMKSWWMMEWWWWNDDDDDDDGYVKQILQNQNPKSRIDVKHDSG